MALPAGRVGVSPDQVDRNGRIKTPERTRQVFSGTGSSELWGGIDGVPFDAILYYHQSSYSNPVEHAEITDKSGDTIMDLWMGTASGYPSAITIPLMKGESFVPPVSPPEGGNITWRLIEL